MSDHRHERPGLPLACLLPGLDRSSLSGQPPGIRIIRQPGLGATHGRQRQPGQAAVVPALPAADGSSSPMDGRPRTGFVPSGGGFSGCGGSRAPLVPAWETRPARWWDVDYLPLREQEGLRGLLGRITPAPETVEKPAAGLPETIVTLRQRHREQLGDLFLSRRLPALRRVAEQVGLASRLRMPVRCSPGRRAPARRRWLASSTCAVPSASVPLPPWTVPGCRPWRLVRCCSVTRVCWPAPRWQRCTSRSRPPCRANCKRYSTNG